MKAVRFHSHGGPEVLRLEEVPRPIAAAGEVLVRIEAAGVNYADTVRRWGDHYPLPTPLPSIAGSEIVGTIEAVGEGIGPDLIGLRVLGSPASGGYAQYVAVPRDMVFALPAGLHPHQGLALFIQGLTAALILKQSGRLIAGESVLVEGAAGGVGSLGVQLARLYGARIVIGAASTPDKRAQVLALGADCAIDYSTPGWSAEVRRVTAGLGVNVVMEMTGGEVFREAMQCLAPGGRVVVYGIASRVPYQVPSERLIASGQGVIGFYVGQFLQQRALVEATLAEMAEFVRRGQLRPEIGGLFPLAEAAEVHRRVESRQSAGKLIFVPDA